MFIANNVNCILNEIQAYNTQYADSGTAIKVVAVTKNQSIEAMRTALTAGIHIVGENRVQEAINKHAVLGDAAEWHFIGHLQTNKVRQIVPFCQLIHSVDSERLAVEISRSAAKFNKCQDVLLQVNIAGESTKFGVSRLQAIKLAKFLTSLDNIRVCGCMTIAPFAESSEQTRPIFREMFQLFKELQTLSLPNSNLQWLSMGMTNDYRVAIEEGANLVRIGTGIFGERRY